MRRLIGGMMVAALTAAAPVAPVPREMTAAVAAKTRAPANVARDRFRHPAATLAFFGVKPTDTVVELIPGGGWYTEVLAPYLAARGTYWVAGGWDRGLNGVKAVLAKNVGAYGKVRLAAFPASAGAPAIPPGSADVVLTFRNVHNLRFSGIDKTQAAFAEMFRMLKPGGTLGSRSTGCPRRATPPRRSRADT